MSHNLIIQSELAKVSPRRIKHTLWQSAIEFDADAFSTCCSNVALHSQDPRARALLHLCEVLPALKSPPSYILLENVKNFETSQRYGA
jgi:site-specific DNA-cytosine methylase